MAFRGCLTRGSTSTWEQDTGNRIRWPCEGKKERGEEIFIDPSRFQSGQAMALQDHRELPPVALTLWFWRKGKYIYFREGDCSSSTSTRGWNLIVDYCDGLKITFSVPWGGVFPANPSQFLLFSVFFILPACNYLISTPQFPRKIEFLSRKHQWYSKNEVKMSLNLSKMRHRYFSDHCNPSLWIREPNSSSEPR